MKCDMNCLHCQLPESKCHGGSRHTSPYEKGALRSGPRGSAKRDTYLPPSSRLYNKNGTRFGTH